MIWVILFLGKTFEIKRDKSNQMEKKITYPMRINKYLALQNITTRREADELIKAGEVKINGKLAVLGDKVSKKDKVTVDKKIQDIKKLVYLAYNKPVGIITHGPQGQEKSIRDVFNFTQKVFPVGRLDKDSCGLMILTNDGRITDKLLNPDYEHEKEYIVKVNKSLSPSFIEHMKNPMVLGDGHKTKKCKVEKRDNFSFSIILTEGKKRQIRRMCEKLNHHVTELKRIRIINIKLGKLASGKYRKISGPELAEFMETIGIKNLP